MPLGWGVKAFRRAPYLSIWTAIGFNYSCPGIVLGTFIGIILAEFIFIPLMLKKFGSL